VGKRVLSAKVSRLLSSRRITRLPVARCLLYNASTMVSREASGRASELRRYARQIGPWPVVLETRDGWLRVPVIDLSPGGAKVCLAEPLKDGTKGRLYFLPPYWRPRAVEAIVWRTDLDGIVLLFTGPSITPPLAARDGRPADSWRWTWEARAPSPPS
jgi:PilZ domain